MSTISFKLDAEAMAALFPEGSEARLELQQTVIDEMTRKIIDRNVRSLQNTIDAAVKTQYGATLSTLGIKVTHSALTLSEEAKALIASHAKATFESVIRDAVAAIANPELDEMRRRLKDQLDRGLRNELVVLAKAALRDAVK